MPDLDLVYSEYSKLLDTLQAPVARAIQRTLDAFDAGIIPDLDELHDLLVRQILISNAHARGVADVLASAIIEEYTGINPRPTGRTPVTGPEEEQRLKQSVGTVLAAVAAGADITARIHRLGSSELEQALQGQLSTSYENAGIAGWRRQLEPDACPLCTKWAGGGKTIPTSVTPNHHPGCRCVPVPVTADLEDTYSDIEE